MTEFPVTVHWLRFDVFMCTIVAHSEQGVKSVVREHVKSSLFPTQPVPVADVTGGDSAV